MPLTSTQWYEKIVKILPAWWFEYMDNQEAHARGLAALFADLDDSAQNLVDQTYILLASGDFHDQQGEERGVDRLTDELDNQYRVRVQRISNESNCPSIQSIVNQLIMTGTVVVREDFKGLEFMDRESFVNRGVIILEEIVNAFSIIVDKQIHEPYSFADREYFMGRENYMGAAESSQYVFDLILAAVNNAKAEGTAFRIIERAT